MLTWSIKVLNLPNTLPPQVQNYYDDVLISTNHPSLIMGIGAEESSLKAKNGSTFTRSRYEKLPMGLVPLTGAPTNGVQAKRIDVSATVQYYGLFQAVNQQIELNNSDSVLNSLAQLNGLSMRMSEDKLMSDMLEASTGFINCTGGSNGDLPSNLTESSIMEAISALRQNDAPMLMIGEEGRDAFGTAPTFDAYVVKANTRVIPDLSNLTDFVPKWNYPRGGEGCLPSEEGSFRNSRWLVSSAGTVTPQASGMGRDVYSNYIHGTEAIGTIRQDNFSSGLRYRPPMYSDPLFQNYTIGWVAALVPYVVNELNILKLRCTLSN